MKLKVTREIFANIITLIILFIIFSLPYFLSIIFFSLTGMRTNDTIKHLMISYPYISNWIHGILLMIVAYLAIGIVIWIGVIIVTIFPYLLEFIEFIYSLVHDFLNYFIDNSNKNRMKHKSNIKNNCVNNPMGHEQLKNIMKSIKDNWR